VHCYFYQIQLLNPNLSNLNPIQNYTPLYLRSVLIQASNLPVGFLGGFCLSGCLTKTFLAFLIDHMHTAYPADCIFLGFITILIFSEEYKLVKLLAVFFLYILSSLALHSLPPPPPQDTLYSSIIARDKVSHLLNRE